MASTVVRTRGNFLECDKIALSRMKNLEAHMIFLLLIRDKMTNSQNANAGMLDLIII